ncbi:MAG: ATP-dependent Clp protease ATP-binding subunit ClpA [Deltaproteobacteria bacterium]|nr:ATP-dependent Clp protease ATP-binding subunit ClpA [Deltaproteobacteria bacterium]MBW2416632.1 ATP-dependent Clp protease ATP-binding subunit ClpA [Deltaproteobacteria bacterium]
MNREFQLTLQAAFREALSRRHAYLTVEHLLYALCHDERGIETLRACGASVDRLKKELEAWFDASIEPEPGDEPVDVQQTLAFHRVVEAALRHMENAEKEQVDAGDVLAAIFGEPDSYAVELLRAMDVTRADVLGFISHGTRKSDTPKEDAGSGSQGFAMGDDEEEIADPLTAFATNLTERASLGKLDPLVGREAEIERAIHILARRRKNNPIFVGESGVGKTALAEGLAQKIHEGKIPDDLRNAEIYAVDLGAMLAGTRYRGDFEARFKAFVQAVQERDNPIVFIDEIHTVLGAGAAQGATVDASNMLKPLLQSGELRCMGSTTYQEYRHFERDRALARRFQRIDVHEPSIDDAVKILEGLAPRYEEHHKVHYTAPALRAAVELSAKHLMDRHLPDKAIDVMDEAGAAVRLQPASRRKKNVGVRDIEALVARMAQIPIQSTNSSEREKLENLEAELKAGVYGQDEAISTLTRAIKRTRAGLGGADRPIGSFLFMGPTGVGKTELAKQIASCLGVPFLRFDMSEYMEKHAVARLIGAPPGYVGYDEGGILVDRVRKNPYAVVLLDEIEKAHQDLFDILLQVMDHATLTDNHGREADFRHITLIMTSNVGARDLTRRSIGFEGGVSGTGSREVERLFSPEFRNRLDETVTFNQLSPDVMGRVVDKFVREMEAQLAERKVQVDLTDAARAWLAKKGYDPHFGARPLARVLQTELKDKFADEILFGSLIKGGTVHVDAGDDELTLSFEPRES